MSKIVGKMAGCYSPMGRTMILQDAEGNELSTGVVIGQEKKFTATDRQVYSGFTYVSDEGASTGTREFISYRTVKAEYIVFPNESFSIPLDYYNMYDYTEFQCMIAKFNTAISDSVAVEKVSISGNVYASNSSDIVSNVTKNNEEKLIELNIVNNTENSFIIYYFMYKQEEI